MHYDRFCDFEWSDSENGQILKTSCDFAPGKIEVIGDYHKFECAVRINHVDRDDRGLWMCEVEKYYPGFSRRYSS